MKQTKLENQALLLSHWSITVRDLVITKLKQFIADNDGYGIPRYFDCDDEESIKDPTELDSMSDEQLLEAFEVCVGFGG